MSVYAATQAFGSELRVHLIHYYASHPGRQIDAVRALGVERAVVSLNNRALIETGVLTVDEDKVYSIDQDRLDELLDALRRFGEPEKPNEPPRHG